MMAQRNRCCKCARTSSLCRRWWQLGRQNGQYLRRPIFLKLLFFAIVGPGCWYLLSPTFTAVDHYTNPLNYRQETIVDLDSNKRELDEDFQLIELSNEDTQRIEREMLRRRARVKDMCKNRGNLKTNFETNATLYEPMLRKLLIDRSHNIAWCPIYKAGSSFMMELFARMGGKMTHTNLNRLEKGEIQINALARLAYRPIRNIENATKLLNASNRFIVVRHPFERLLSAYRDKLEHRAGREYFYQKYGRAIIWFYRNGRYIRNRKGKKRPGREKIEPTFLEYLRFIAEKRLFDEHWRPYTMECLPCELDYKYIVKIETFLQDISYLVSKLALKSFLPSLYRTVTKKLKQTEESVDNLAQFYYRQIPPTLLQQIYLLYEDDFILFNYSPKKYFEITKNYDL